MIKSKKELKSQEYKHGKDLSSYIQIFKNGETGFSIKTHLNLIGMKWLFRTLAKILKAEVKVKVWCEKCRGIGIIVDISSKIPADKCKICKGLGYTEKTLAELK
jgi:hypothetical protein